MLIYVIEHTPTEFLVATSIITIDISLDFDQTDANHKHFGWAY